MHKTIETLKARKAEIMARLMAFNRRFRYWEPTAEELMTFERDTQAVMAINAAIEREDAARRPLTRADMQAQIKSIMRQEQEAMCHTQPRRR
jgi:hypothetical protein